MGAGPEAGAPTARWGRGMQRFRIVHQTYYNFSGAVTLLPHTLLLRPREDHELRIESSRLEIRPAAQLRWHRDVEDNSVAVASFEEPAPQLAIESEVIIQQFNEAPLDFVVEAYAVGYPFAYREDDLRVLHPYLNTAGRSSGPRLPGWVRALYGPGTSVETYVLLQQICQRIHDTLGYQSREEPGVQSGEETLARGSGSCRDFAFLFIESARSLGLAARFVSGYLQAPPSAVNYGATHAWAEVFLPGAGWKGFDPTLGTIVGVQHIPVAVACSPESVPPVAGSFVGPPGASMEVGVWVIEL